MMLPSVVLHWKVFFKILLQVQFIDEINSFVLKENSFNIILWRDKGRAYLEDSIFLHITFAWKWYTIK